MSAPASLRRVAAALLAAVAAPLLLLGVVLPGASSPARAAPAATELTDSAVTVTGRAGRWDDFSKLRITVSQTRNLSAQGITVTWSGAAPTGVDRYVGKNYLQFMQCWGADPDAAGFRETCQYGRGVLPSDPRTSVGLGNAINLRSVGKSSLYAADPAEELQLPQADGARSVPFHAVDGVRTPNGGKHQPYPPGGGLGLTDYFSEFTTNEIPYARTTPDGTGRTTFEVQTVAEAPGLGCGQPQKVGKTVVGRPCWLVIVPRGEHDPSGKPVTGNPNGSVIDGSPLSRSNFANRIAVKLDFLPVDTACAQGKDERLTAGTELVGQAVQSWQPALCANSGPVFGFINATDVEANRYVREPAVGDGPGLAFVTDAQEAAAGDPRILHAPVALGAVVISMQIETKIVPGAPEAVQKLRGTQVRDLKLTPRLVAKMLTQSYKADVPAGTSRGDSVPLTNPLSVRNDPEFLALNPLFDNFTPTSKPEGLMVTLGNSALAREIWEWILADPDAIRWLAGRPDESGMVVNKHYLPLFASDGVPQNFPKEDPSCVQPPEAVVPNPAQDPNNPDDDFTSTPWCTFALRPYLNSLREAAVQTLRGDAKVRNTWDATTVPPGYKAAPPQPVGERFSLSITDSASAARYGLAAASLRNRHGDFVAPNADGLLAGVAGMTAGKVDGVVVNNPRRAVPGEYPLTMLTYAAVNQDQPGAARAEYARLLRHAAGPGQTPGTARGQLPAGYVPLPSPMRDRTKAAAALLEEGNGPPTQPPASPAGAQPGPITPAGTTPASTAPAGVPDRGAAVPALPAATARPSVPVNAVPVALTAESSPLGWRRFVLVTILAVGLASAISGPVLLMFGYRRSTPGAGS